MRFVKHLTCVWQWSGSHWAILEQSSISTLCYCLRLRRYLEFQVTSKGLADKPSSNSISTHPYAHPLHMKVMKHLLCVWQWNVSHLGWVYSLNIVTSLLLAHQEVYLSGGNVRFHTIWKVASNDVGEGCLLGPIIVWSWVNEFGVCGWRNRKNNCYCRWGHVSAVILFIGGT